MSGQVPRARFEQGEADNAAPAGEPSTVQPGTQIGAGGGFIVCIDLHAKSDSVPSRLIGKRVTVMASSGRAAIRPAV
jgi:hypothetical protein